MKRDLLQAFDTLSSREGSDHAAVGEALGRIERTVASLALDAQSGPADALDRFLALQDGFEYNIVLRLIEWLSRQVMVVELLERFPPNASANVLRCLRLVQGVLLLHRPSQRLFSRKPPIETLLYLATIADRAYPKASTSSSANLTEGTEELSLAALDTLLCAIVDRPKNTRVFEDLGGLATIVKMLKKRSLSKAVRIKVIEILYYYLLPESTASLARVQTDPNLANILESSKAADFIPQTPVKLSHTELHDYPRSPSTSRGTPELVGLGYEGVEMEDPAGGAGAETNDGTPKAKTPLRPVAVMDNTTPTSSKASPVKRGMLLFPPSPSASRHRAGGGDSEPSDVFGSSWGSSTSTSTAPRSPRLIPPPSPQPSNSPLLAPASPASHHSSSAPSSARSSSSSVFSTTSSFESRKKYIKTEEDKRELLRSVMGNVDALEERFKVMGLR